MEQDNIVKEIKNIILKKSTIKNVITVYKVMNPQHTKAVNDILTMIEDPLKGIEESVSNIAEYTLDEEHCKKLSEEED